MPSIESLSSAIISALKSAYLPHRAVGLTKDQQPSCDPRAQHLDRAAARTLIRMTECHWRVSVEQAEKTLLIVKGSILHRIVLI